MVNLVDPCLGFELGLIRHALARLLLLQDDTWHAPGKEQVLCPITLNPIREPVMTCDGFLYEQAAIICWLEQNDTSPCSNLPLAHKRVLNLALPQEISEDFAYLF